MKQNIILITDPNKDTDDLTALIMLDSLCKAEKINIAGIVTTHGNAQTTLKRAQYTSGVFNILGSDISICAGEGLVPQNEIAQSSFNKFYLTGGSDEVLSYANANKIFTDSLKYLKDIFSSADRKSLDLLIIAPMTDVAKFIKAEPELFLEKIRTITVMGGLNTAKDKNYLTPDLSSNNANDTEASNAAYAFLSKHNLPVIIVNRFAVMEVPVNWEYFEKMKDSGTFLGRHIYEIQKIAFRGLFLGLLGGESLKRQTPEWFFETFTDIPKSEFEMWKEKCRGNEQDNAINQIIDRIVRFNMYDPLALIACIDEYKPLFTVEQFDNFWVYQPKNKEAIYKLFKELIKIK